MSKNVSKYNPFKVFKSSQSLRSFKGIKVVIKTVYQNIYNELAYVTIGIRRTNFWKEDTRFMDLYNRSKAISLLSPHKLYSLYHFAENAKNLSGDVAELGVYKGGSALLLSEVFSTSSPQKTVHLFDTWEGMPMDFQEYESFSGFDFSDITYTEVKENLKNCRNVQFYKGMFSNTFPSVTVDAFCFVHIDCDIYSSVKQCCEFFYSRMVSGGIMLFDDYGFICCPGAKKAVDEFFVDKTEMPIYLTTGQCVIIKR